MCNTRNKEIEDYQVQIRTGKNVLAWWSEKTKENQRLAAWKAHEEKKEDESVLMITTYHSTVEQYEDAYIVSGKGKYYDTG